MPFTEFHFDYVLILNHLIHLVIAYILALPIAYNREKEARSAGLRTFPLVAIGCCAYTLIGREVLQGYESQARILYGLMAGIGFIGGGAILKKQKGIISGTATAAGIWITGAIGAATAWQRYEIGILLSVITFITYKVNQYMKRDISTKKDGLT